MSGPRIFFTGIVLYVVFSFARVFFVFGSGSFYRLLGLLKPKIPRGKQKNKKNKGFSGMSGLRTLFRGIGFFGFPRVFLIFDSGSFYRLLGPPKNLEENQKNLKDKKNKGFSGMSGPRTLFRGIDFLCFFGFPRVFSDFWLRKHLSATRITNNPKTSRKTKKTKGFSGMSGLRTFFRCSGVSCVFLVFVSWFW